MTTTPIKPGTRVRYIGILGRTDGPTGRVLTVSRYGLRIRWNNGPVELVHPEDVIPC